MKEDSHIDYFQLISRYLSGNSSDSEVQLLEEWVLSSTENRAQFSAFRNAWILSGIEGNYQNIDVEEEWQATAGQLFSEGKIVPMQARPRRRVAFFLKIAAAAALLVAASLWLFLSLNKPNLLEVVAQNEVKENLLPDGTQISLNKFSSVKYGTGEKYRRVELAGDAFFEVKRDTAHPFVITAQAIEIEVLGTAFYVDAREGQNQIQVIVQSGSVAISAGAEKVTLTAGETGIFDKKTGKLHEKQNENVNYLAWKTGVLQFENVDLESVVFDLNRKFHSQVSIASPTLKDCEITATFEHKSLDAIVKIIEKTLGISAGKNGGEIVFSGQSCK
jgi:transmembrane sensor